MAVRRKFVDPTLEEHVYTPLALPLPPAGPADASDIAYRRAAFVLEEARCGLLARDNTVTCALRALANYLSLERDAPSSLIKRMGRYITKGAVERRMSLTTDGTVDWKAFTKATWTEYPEDIKVLWRWIVERGKELTAQDVLDHIARYPVVVMTNEENRRLASRQRKEAGRAPEYYFEASGIIVMRSASARQRAGETARDLPPTPEPNVELMAK